MDRALHFLFKTNSGRLVLVVLAAMLVAYIARLQLIDKPAAEAKEASGVGAETLERMAETLVETVDARGAVTLPARTEWYPAQVPCGAEVPYPTQRDPVWDLLGLEKTGNTLFQYRFEHANGDIKIHARRDSDCDGHYAVWLLEGTTTSSLTHDLTAQNILE